MRLKLGLALVLMALSGAAYAQSSQKPLQIIVPFAPGGSADGIGRILADRARRQARPPGLRREQAGRRRLTRPDHFGESPARWRHDRDCRDRRTGDQSPCAGFDRLRSGQGAHPSRQADRDPLVFVANPKTGPKTVKDMIEQSKAKPGRLEFWQHRREFQPASLSGVVQEGDRRQPRPHSLSRQRPRGAGRGRRRQCR